MSDYKKKRRSSLPTESVLCLSVVSDGAPDNFIIAPEIMSTMLENLDFRSLKQVRLVCKRWLREAQTHMERRGIIRFDRETSTRRIREFEDLRTKKIPDLPQPFHCVDVDLVQNNLVPVMKVVLSNSSSPLSLTRFSTESFDVDLAVRLIIEHSPNLEYLKLTRETFNDAHTLKKGQMFPKLRHLVVKDDKEIVEEDIYTTIDFPSFVAKIVKGSPNLETIEFQNVAEPKGRELLRTVDIKNIKCLTLDHEDPKQSLIDYFLTIPFGKLQNLKLKQYTGGSELTKSPLEIVKTCSDTLRVLDVTSADEPDDILQFPVCPNVQKLLLYSFPKALSILRQCFPSLQVLQVNSIDVDVDGNLWRHQSPFPGLKTLRVLNADVSTHSGVFYFKFFKKLPGLECLSLNVAAVLRCCRLKASGKLRSWTTLQGLKHLEIRGPYAKDFDDDGAGGNNEATSGDKTDGDVGADDDNEADDGDEADDDDKADDTDYSSLATLKEVEMITLLDSNEALFRIPVHEMPRLRVLWFPWGVHHSMGKLLALAKRMEKVVITNCCSYPRVGKNPWAKEVLNLFLDSAPNVVCGCKGLKHLEIRGPYANKHLGENGGDGADGNDEATDDNKTDGDDGADDDNGADDSVVADNDFGADDDDGADGGVGADDGDKADEDDGTGDDNGNDDGDKADDDDGADDGSGSDDGDAGADDGDEASDDDGADDGGESHDDDEADDDDGTGDDNGDDHRAHDIFYSSLDTLTDVEKRTLLESNEALIRAYGPSILSHARVEGPPVSLGYPPQDGNAFGPYPDYEEGVHHCQPLLLSPSPEESMLE